VNGNLAISAVANLTNISETIAAPASVSGTSVYVDYRQGSIFYVNAALTGNYTCFIANIPSQTNRTYVVNLISKTSVTGVWCANIVRLNNTDYSASNVYDTAYVPFCGTGFPNVSLSTAPMIVQYIGILKTGTGAGSNLVVTNVNPMWNG